MLEQAVDEARPGRAGSSRRACSGSNHSARSTSGNSRSRPLRGGHSIAKVLLLSAAGSNSASAAQASTTLPALWRTEPSSISASGASSGAGAELLAQLAQGAVARLLARPRSRPSGSSRRRASRLAQKGPPGWTSRNSGALRRAAEEEDPGAALGGHRRRRRSGGSEGVDDRAERGDAPRSRGRRGERLEGAVGAGHRDPDRERHQQLGPQLRLGHAAAAEDLGLSARAAARAGRSLTWSRTSSLSPGWPGRG